VRPLSARVQALTATGRDGVCVFRIFREFRKLPKATTPEQEINNLVAIYRAIASPGFPFPEAGKCGRGGETSAEPAGSRLLKLQVRRTYRGADERYPG